MKLTDLIDKYLTDQRVLNLMNNIYTEKKNNICITGLSGSSLAFVLYSLSILTRRLIIVVLQFREEAINLLNDFEILFNDAKKELNERSAFFYPESYSSPYNILSSDSTFTLLRTTILHRLINSSTLPSIIVCCPQSFIEPIPDTKTLEKECFKVQVGEMLNMEVVINILENFDFVNVDYVFECGQYAIRGGIIDVFSYSNQHPFRIEFSEDIIRQIRCFDPITQHSFKQVHQIVIYPNANRENLNKRTNFLEILPKDTIFISIPEHIFDLTLQQEFEKYKAQDEVIEKEDFYKILDNFYTLKEIKKYFKSLSIIENYSGLAIPEVIRSTKHFRIQPHPSFGRSFKLLFESLIRWSEDEYSIIIFYENEKNLQRYQSILENLSLELNEQMPEIHLINSTLHSGFVDHDLRICILTEHQITDRQHRYRFFEKSSQAEALTLRDLKNIQPGDYVVHIDYGVGRYAGLETITVQGRKQEAVRIIYRDEDELLVSIHSLHKITKYVGKDGGVPKLDKLGSSSWLRRKYEAKKKVKDIARELIRLYALRKASKGFSFLPDCSFQHELEASFIYEETEDQAKAIQESKADMEAFYPMDRLICGDVGFGKTEVAIRAAFKAAMSGKQTALLVPTTILAFQHFQTFSERMKDFPVVVEYISRFRKKNEIQRILDDLRIGKIDIIIGTHRLLSKDVDFKDLGLLIIDEEQKFGVIAKEHLRKIKVNVDTLTLTATPIPRTLQFALMSARDISVINTPPPNRLPVYTEFISFNLFRIREIIMYEINRGGQVFFIHNRIHNIYKIAEKLINICPDVKIDVAHGQMKGEDLENKIIDFMSGLIDVFVCTTIIESGIDIPNANTIIINDAHHFGLSDLYQLRGRVGRSNRKAYCYLITPPLAFLNEQSRKRLKAIVELSDLGSGLQLALRDLDIRGAGDLFGAQQSGFIAEIGYEMYNKILEEALEELKVEEQIGQIQLDDISKIVKDCILETDLSLLIPDWYVPQINERMALYRTLSNMQTQKQLQAFKANLQDRFGSLPPQVEELIKTIELRWIARRCGIEKIFIKQSKLTLFFYPFNEEEMKQIHVFKNILNFIIHNSYRAIMKKDNDKIFVVINNIDSISKAIQILNSFVLETDEKHVKLKFD